MIFILGGVAILVALAVGVVFFVQPLAAVALLEKCAPQVLFRVRTQRPLVGLSFDDGPHQVYTRQVLEFLRTRLHAGARLCVSARSGEPAFVVHALTRREKSRARHDRDSPRRHSESPAHDRIVAAHSCGRAQQGTDIRTTRRADRIGAGTRAALAFRGPGFFGDDRDVGDSGGADRIDGDGDVAVSCARIRL